MHFLLRLLPILLFLQTAICSKTRQIPQFVLDHSPMLYLYSEENYYPGDIAAYIPKFELCLPMKNYALVPELQSVLSEISAAVPEEICFENKLELGGLKERYSVRLGRDDGAEKTLRFFEAHKELGLVFDSDKNVVDNDKNVVDNDVNAVLDNDNNYVRDNDKNVFEIPSHALFMTRHTFNPKSSFFTGERPTAMGRAPKTPATLIVRYHHSGVKNTTASESEPHLKDVDFIDAYWGLFYPFNEGAYVMGTGPWGNHLGDWEHVMVRFYPDTKTPNALPEQPFYPAQIWLSAHSGGFAYDFAKITKYDSNVSPLPSKPIIFAAKGTHANYASVGQHAHDVPFFFSPLSDFTDRGLLWDVGSNYYGYSFDSYAEESCGSRGRESCGSRVRETSESRDEASAGSCDRESIRFLPSSQREVLLGSDWLNYRGRWGNAKLSPDHPLQKNGHVQWRYIDGPTGPIGKNLERERICEKDYVANNYIYWNWFHFGSRCHIRRTIKKGAGLDAEKGEFVGDNCGCLLYKIKPVILRRVLELVTWRGLLCYIMEFFTG